MIIKTMRQLLLGIIVILPVYGSLTYAVNAGELEPVVGLGCYAYGDDETPSQAKDKAMARAREQAVSSYKVWVQSSATVEDFQLKNDVIHSISSGMLQQIQIENIKKDGQEVCLRIKGMLAPNSVKEEVDRRKKQKVIKNELMTINLNPGSTAGLKVWLNKADGRYEEDDPLEVYVHSDRDVYLKLDYFQADGTVVHLVPNIFRQQAEIKKGQTYVFGSDDSPERFIISGPFGDEVIKALVSPYPFSKDLQSKAVVSDSETYVKTLKKNLERSEQQKGKRGVKILSGSSASIFTKSHDTLKLEQDLEK